MDRIAGQTDPIHPALQAVLVQTCHRVTCLPGERLDPLQALQPQIPLVNEDRSSPLYGHPKGVIQHRRVVVAHRLLATEHPGGPTPSLPLMAKLKVFIGLRSPDAGAGKRKAGDDRVGDPAVAAFAPQDVQPLAVVVLPVGGVAFQQSSPLAGRTRGAAEEHDKTDPHSFKVVDARLNIQYDDSCV